MKEAACWSRHSKNQVGAARQKQGRILALCGLGMLWLLVPLAPVDPRSLMQGDYMSLNFDIPSAVREELDGSPAVSARVVARRDAQGRARIERLAKPREALAAGELLLPLKQLKGRWTLVTDAFFFTEGQGEHLPRPASATFACCPTAAPCWWGWLTKMASLCNTDLIADCVRQFSNFR